MDNDKSGVNEWRAAFHSLRRVDKERLMIEVIQKIHTLTDDALAASRNDTVMSVFSSKMDELVDSEVLPELFKTLSYLKVECENAKEDIDTAKRIDLYAGGNIDRIRDGFNSLNMTFTNVYETVMQRRSWDMEGDPHSRFGGRRAFNNGRIYPKGALDHPAHIKNLAGSRSTGTVVKLSDYRK